MKFSTIKKINETSNGLMLHRQNRFQQKLTQDNACTCTVGSLLHVLNSRPYNTARYVKLKLAKITAHTIINIHNSQFLISGMSKLLCSKCSSYKINLERTQNCVKIILTYVRFLRRASLGIIGLGDPSFSQ